MFSELIFPMNRYGLLWGPFEKRRQHHSTININVIGVITDESMVYDVIPTKCHGIGTSTKTLPRKPDKKVRRTVRIYRYIYIYVVYICCWVCLLCSSWFCNLYSFLLRRVFIKYICILLCTESPCKVILDDYKSLFSLWWLWILFGLVFDRLIQGTIHYRNNIQWSPLFCLINKLDFSFFNIVFEWNWIMKKKMVYLGIVVLRWRIW